MTKLEFYAAIATPLVAGIFSIILPSANILLGRFHKNNTLHAAEAITQLEYLSQELSIWKESCDLLQVLLSKY